MHSHKRTVVALFSIIAFLVILSAARPALAAKPLTKADVIDLLKGQVPPERVEALARERGIDFRVTSDVESELRRAGATDDLISTFRSLAPKGGGTGTGVEIEATPGNAEVYVDDERVGKTSSEGRLKIPSISPGQHRLRISLDAYRDFENTIEVKRGEATSVVTQLQSSSSSGGRTTTSSVGSSGRALMARVIEGLGGNTKVRSVRTFRTHGTITLYLPQGQLEGDVESVGDFSGRVWQRLATQFGSFVYVGTSSSAFVIQPNGVQDMTPIQKKEMLDGLWRNGYYICQHMDDPGFSFTPGGDADVNGISMKVLDIRGAGADTRWFIDPSTGWVMRATWTEMGTGSTVQVQEDFEDYQVVSGYYVPLKSTRMNNGQIFAVGTLAGLEVNPPIDSSLFAR